MNQKDPSRIYFDIIIPVYNEGNNIKNVLEKFKYEVRSKFRILLCYDHDDDSTLTGYDDQDYEFEIILVKNKKSGAHSAVITGMDYSTAPCVLVFPADDTINQKIIDSMYELFLEGCDVVVASRFMKGGSMKNCPLLKSILVRTASKTLYWLTTIPVQDASNGFRLFSRNLLNHVEIESEKGFSFSIELLVKAERLGMKIGEVPAQWEERTKGISRFQVIRWSPSYLRWYCYGFLTTYFVKKIN